MFDWRRGVIYMSKFWELYNILTELHISLYTKTRMVSPEVVGQMTLDSRIRFTKCVLGPVLEVAHMSYETLHFPITASVYLDNVSSLWLSLQSSQNLIKGVFRILRNHFATSDRNPWQFWQQKADFFMWICDLPTLLDLYIIQQFIKKLPRSGSIN